MEYKLTSKYQHAKRLPKGVRRSIRLYFLNGVRIFEQKVPFDEKGEFGDPKWHFKNEYLLNGRMYQTRWSRNWSRDLGGFVDTSRDVSYPISKKILEQFNIPKDLKIVLTEKL